RAAETSPAGQPADVASGRPLILTRDTPANWTLSGVFTSAFGRPASVTPGNAPLPKVLVSQLFIADVSSKSVRQLTTDNAVYFEPTWSRDGQSIVCSSSEGRDPWTGPLNLYVINAETGTKRALTTGAGDKRMATVSPDGRVVAYVGGDHLKMASVFT